MIQHLPQWEMGSFEPYISTETMQAHVDLHRGYVDRLNSRIPEAILRFKPSYVLRNLPGFLSEPLRQFYRDNMGGNIAHTLFWKTITPKPSLVSRLESISTDTALIIDEVLEEGLKVVGSGWVWGALGPHGFRVYSTRNHDTPYMRSHTPIFCVDVWEHAYYIDQRGDREAWLQNVLSYIDWEFVEERVRECVWGQDDLDSLLLEDSTT